MVKVFPIDDFLAYFDEFEDTTKYTRAHVQACGRRAQHYIKDSVFGMPLPCDDGDREYALFLMAAHILSLKSNLDDGNSSAGRVKKSIVGNVSVETDSPNGYLSNDISYWLGQTQYGLELLALLEFSAPLGAFTNQNCESVRVLT